MTDGTEAAKELTTTTANTPAVDSNIESISAIITRLSQGEETSRAMIAVGMLNLFIAAADKIGGRRALNLNDFMAYGCALAAIETIKPSDLDYTGQLGAQAVERELQRARKTQ
jgi:hypothetical protein